VTQHGLPGDSALTRQGVRIDAGGLLSVLVESARVSRAGLKRGRRVTTVGRVELGRVRVGAWLLVVLRAGAGPADERQGAADRMGVEVWRPAGDDRGEEPPPIAAAAAGARRLFWHHVGLPPGWADLVRDATRLPAGGPDDWKEGGASWGGGGGEEEEEEEGSGPGDWRLRCRVESGGAEADGWALESSLAGHAGPGRAGGRAWDAGGDDGGWGQGAEGRLDAEAIAEGWGVGEVVRLVQTFRREFGAAATERYSALVAGNGVDGRALLSMRDDDLAEMGVTDPAHRALLLREVESRTAWIKGISNSCAEFD
jgi:hypothetical protein